MQALRKLTDGDVARLRSGQYRGDAAAAAPGAFSASSDPRGRATVAVDLTIVESAPPLNALGNGSFSRGSFAPAPTWSDRESNNSTEDSGPLNFFVYVHSAHVGKGDAHAQGTAGNFSEISAVASCGPVASATSAAERRATWLALATRTRLPAESIELCTYEKDVEATSKSPFQNCWARAAFLGPTVRVCTQSIFVSLNQPSFCSH